MHKITIAILQPGYMPWLGFFEQMARADIFVYYDNVQYTRRDWRNRNRIKIEGKQKWLTVPVMKAPQDSLICDIRISYDNPWFEKHLNILHSAYGRTKYFHDLFPQLKEILQAQPKWLLELDVQIASIMAQHLRITTPFIYASDIPNLSKDRNMRLIEICMHLGADVLYDGKSAVRFIDRGLFEQHKIQVVFQEYDHPVYPQGKDPFVPYLSAVDLIFHHGPRSREIMLSKAKAKGSVPES